MKICDVTQFYSPVSGGVKRYLHEKIAFIQTHRPRDEHILIVPGPADTCEVNGRTRVYSIASPLVSSTTRYRVLCDLRGLAAILDREKPHLIECSDPYQLGWSTLAAGRRLAVPVIGFYHSHFAEAYVRAFAKFAGTGATLAVMTVTRRYVRHLYNGFAATLVASRRLGLILTEWGVDNVNIAPLGVNTATFRPDAEDRAKSRQALGVHPDTKILLYVGRLAEEKNTGILVEVFRRILASRRDVSVVVVGDGSRRAEVQALATAGPSAVTWIPYHSSPNELASLYRAADLFVHPGVQETFGLVALEAQACGTPVLGFRGTAMDEIIVEGTADWAEQQTAEALVRALDGAVQRDLNSRRDTIAQAVRERHSWQRAFERLFSIYEQVRSDYTDRRGHGRRQTIHDSQLPGV